MSAKAERLYLRIDAEQKALLAAASQATGASVSAFVLRAAANAAADVLADRRVLMPDHDAWRMFDEALNRPAGDVSGLRELLAGPTILDTGPLADTGDPRFSPIEALLATHVVAGLDGGSPGAVRLAG